LTVKGQATEAGGLMIRGAGPRTCILLLPGNNISFELLEALEAAIRFLVFSSLTLAA